MSGIEDPTISVNITSGVMHCELTDFFSLLIGRMARNQLDAGIFYLLGDWRLGHNGRDDDHTETVGHFICTRDTPGLLASFGKHAWALSTAGRLNRASKRNLIFVY